MGAALSGAVKNCETECKMHPTAEAMGSCMTTCMLKQHVPGLPKDEKSMEHMVKEKMKEHNSLHMPK